MLKKAREAGAAHDGNAAKDLSKSVLESSRQIWLAGLGAFSRAQAEGMKVFESLVQQGEAVETKTRQAATDTASAARHAAQSKANKMQQIAGGTWDKLEKVFEDRVARALSRLGIHTQADVERLSERVDALSDAVNRLIQSGSGSTRKPRDAAQGAGTSPRVRKTARASATGSKTAEASADSGDAHAGKTSRRRAAKGSKGVRPAAK